MKITEIIPSNAPEWFQQDMDEGQLFNRVIKRVEELQIKITKLESKITTMNILQSKSIPRIQADAIENAVRKFSTSVDVFGGIEIDPDDLLNYAEKLRGK